MKTCNSIWKDHKNKIETKYFKARSSDPNLKDDVPLHIVSSQWKELVKYWHTSDVEMTSKRESTDKMNVWLMTRRANDPEVIQSLDEFNRQLFMLPKDCRTLEARNAIFHESIGHGGHGYCRTYGRTVPQSAMYKDGARSS
ncbi:uncharacterized protein LOC114261484 [Camellia sinensis]|uniref:uncharacterized protein LOC114261484 n=1 Tax=Camellia sinensis TaxID=4442 RepID=UPI001036006E|nr:uncharacterized protein LOC114261484 [Camellia sinensis]